MKAKRPVVVATRNAPVSNRQEQVTALLGEIAALYRERFRALYNGNKTLLESLTQQIDTLRTKLDRL